MKIPNKSLLLRKLASIGDVLLEDFFNHLHQFHMYYFQIILLEELF